MKILEKIHKRMKWSPPSIETFCISSILAVAGIALNNAIAVFCGWLLLTFGVLFKDM